MLVVLWCCVWVRDFIIYRKKFAIAKWYVRLVVAEEEAEEEVEKPAIVQGICFFLATWKGEIATGIDYKELKADRPVVVVVFVASWCRNIVENNKLAVMDTRWRSLAETIGNHNTGKNARRNFLWWLRWKVFQFLR